MFILFILLCFFFLGLALFLKQFIWFYVNRKNSMVLSLETEQKKAVIATFNRQMTVLDKLYINASMRLSKADRIAKLLEDIYRILNWRCNYWEFVEHDQRLVLGQQRGMTKAYLDAVEQAFQGGMPIGGYGTGRAVATKQAVIVNDWTADPRLKNAYFLGQVGNHKSLGSFPIETDQHIYGALAIYGYHTNQFKLNEIQFFTIVANSLAIIIEKSL